MAYDALNYKKFLSSHITRISLTQKKWSFRTYQSSITSTGHIVIVIIIIIIIIIIVVIVP
jgi:hypothetical protein